jgi:murein DD-endopeptidase MepM/ murein hydrolase activator NlpD
MKFYESKTAKFLAGKGFYGVLAVCMAAVAVATYSAIKTGENVAVPQDANQSQTSGNGSVSEITLPSVPSEDTLINQPSSMPDTTEVGNEGEATYFSLPIDGEIIKGYSDSVLQYSSTFNDMRIHTGMDILGQSGARVSACAQGVVCGIEENTVYGTVVAIDHGNGNVIRYCGIKNITVALNDSVEAGDVIGEVGTVANESEDQPHIHIELLKDGVLSDIGQLFE